MAPTSEEVLAMTDADWDGMRLSRNDLASLHKDLMHRLGVGAQDLRWLNRALEREQHGHTRAQTSTD